MVASNNMANHHNDFKVGLQFSEKKPGSKQGQVLYFDIYKTYHEKRVGFTSKN